MIVLSPPLSGPTLGLLVVAGVLGLGTYLAVAGDGGNASREPVLETLSSGPTQPAGEISAILSPRVRTKKPLCREWTASTHRYVHAGSPGAGGPAVRVHL